MLEPADIPEQLYMSYCLRFWDGNSVRVKPLEPSINVLPYTQLHLGDKFLLPFP